MTISALETIEQIHQRIKDSNTTTRPPNGAWSGIQEVSSMKGFPGMLVCIGDAYGKGHDDTPARTLALYKDTEDARWNRNAVITVFVHRDPTGVKGFQTPNEGVLAVNFFENQNILTFGSEELEAVKTVLKELTT